MSFLPILDIYLDLDAPGGRPCLLQGTSGAALNALSFISGDKFLLRLHPRRRNGVAASTTVQLDADFGLAFAAKATPAGSTLFSATTFTEDDTDTNDYFYEATLDLNTEALTSALATTSPLTITCDIEVQADSNATRVTYQFSATARRQIYANELPPVLPGSELEIIGGVAYLERIRLKSSTGLYHEITLRTFDGTTVIDVEQTGASKP